MTEPSESPLKTLIAQAKKELYEAEDSLRRLQYALQGRAKRNLATDRLMTMTKEARQRAETLRTEQRLQDRIQGIRFRLEYLQNQHQDQLEKEEVA